MMNWEFHGSSLAATLPAEAGMDSVLKRVRIIWAGLLIAAFICVLLPEWRHPTVRPINNVVVIVVGLVAGFGLGGVIAFFRYLMTKSKAILRTEPNNTAALGRWQSGQILTAGLAEGIVLYGLVLRFMGVDMIRVLPFYVVGIGAMIVLRPKRIE